MSKNNKRDSAENTISRRSLLAWLGKGYVLSLGGASFVSCLGGSGPWDGSLAKQDGTGESEGNADGEDAQEFPFEPGNMENEIFQNWSERTVDRQDLEKIIRTWRLRVDGLVESPREFAFSDLVALPRTDNITDFHCVEGWSVYDVPWNGVHLSEIYKAVRPLPSATHVTFHTMDDKYNESLPLEISKEQKTLLAYGIGGNTIPLKHGFPLRVVIPRLFAYKSAKYIYRIELTDKAVSGFWVERGYSYDAEVPADRLRPGKY